MIAWFYCCCGETRWFMQKGAAGWASGSWSREALCDARFPYGPDMRS